MVFIGRPIQSIRPTALLLAQRSTAVALTKRFQSSSTMGAFTGQNTDSHPLNAYSEKKDFSTAVATDDDGAFERMHLAALISAIQNESDMRKSSPSSYLVNKAVTMDLVEAATAARDTEAYDKILILMRHGEAQHNVFEKKWAEAGHDPNTAEEDEEYPCDPGLTGKGIGQALNLSRRTATFCNDQTGLVPDLIVTSPLRRAAQTALFAFPYHAPHSVTSRPWIFHGGLMERVSAKCNFVTPAEELRRQFPGIDFESAYYANARNNIDISLAESKSNLIQRTNDFLEWIRNRDERIIVVSSHSTWLQSFCGYTLKSEPTVMDMFKKGEMKSIGIKF